MYFSLEEFLQQHLLKANFIITGALSVTINIYSYLRRSNCEFFDVKITFRAKNIWADIRRFHSSTCLQHYLYGSDWVCIDELPGNYAEQFTYKGQ